MMPFATISNVATALQTQAFTNRNCRRPLVVVFLIAALLSPPTMADPTTHISYDYYFVDLKDSTSLRNSLNSKTPIIKDGIPYHGYTYWKVAWHFDYLERDNACSIEDVTTKLNIIYTLPKAVSLPKNIDIFKKYKTYLTALQTHEDGHGNIGIQAAKEIHNSIYQLPSQSSCSSLSTLAKQKAEQIIEIYRQRNAQYDVDTDYGRTQGALLDWN